MSWLVCTEKTKYHKQCPAGEVCIRTDARARVGPLVSRGKPLFLSDTLQTVPLPLLQVDGVGVLKGMDIKRKGDVGEGERVCGCGWLWEAC